MNRTSSPAALMNPTRVRYGVLGLACSLSMITYLDRVCFGTVAPFIQKEFGLSDGQKGLLFTAFALAYAIFEVPSGWLGDVFGPRRTLIRIVLWWSLFTALTGAIFPSQSWPWFAFAAMLAVRFLFGMGEAGAYPNIARAFHNWFPFGERGSAQGAVWMAGRFAGGVTPLVVTAVIVEQGPDVAWRHAFWIFGSIGVLWCGVFWWWFRDRPEQKASVNEAELELIRSSEGDTAPVHGAVPWGRLLRSTNLWVLCLMYFCGAYGWYFNITWLPGFLRTNYGIAPGEKWSASFWQYNFLAGAPLLFGALACLAGGLLTDAFIRRTGNRKWGRRVFGVIGHGICAACYFAAMFAPNVWLFVLAIALAAFWNDITMGSAWASCIDIGRKYSGIVSGCMNTVGNLGGAVAGFATGWILDLHTATARSDLANATAAYLSSGLASGTTGSPLGGLEQTTAQLAQLQLATQRLTEATQNGWTINFISFAAVYVAATFFWLGFDATRPVAPDA
jgi:MFS family permease